MNGYLIPDFVCVIAVAVIVIGITFGQRSLVVLLVVVGRRLGDYTSRRRGVIVAVRRRVVRVWLRRCRWAVLLARCGRVVLEWGFGRRLRAETTEYWGEESALATLLGRWWRRVVGGWWWCYVLLLVYV